MADSFLDNFYDFDNTALATQSILDVFVLQNILDTEDAERLKGHFKTNREIENFLVKNHVVTQDTINKAYSIMLKLPYVELKSMEIPTVLKDTISEKIISKYGIIPFSLDDGLVRIALSRPSDLLAGYRAGLTRIFSEKNLEVELFITGESDFREVVKQYRGQGKNQILIKKGSLPVVYLRNQFISPLHFKKLPKEFVQKYRIVVFGENKKGYFLTAAEEPDSPLTIKIIDFLERQNGIKIEKFATSKEDVDAILRMWDRPTESTKNKPPKMPENISHKVAINEMAPESRQENDVSKGISKLLDSLVPSNQPEITFDTVPKDDEIVGKEDNEQDDNSGKNQAGEKEKEKEPARTEREWTENKKTETANNPEGDDKADLASREISMATESDRNIGDLISQDINSVSELEEIAKEGFIPKTVAAVINFALIKRSSDIHIEPEAKNLRIRCRIDGILQDILKMPLKYHPPVISRIKILSKLKIDESRIPQDGRFDVVFKAHEVDVRVSTLPTVHGEKIVMRILDKSQGILSLEDLGMQGSAFEETIKAINAPFGILLATGPTGSGKSTTLYAILNRISSPQVNIITLEDPVEYDIAGINQCQIKPEIGFTFASGLRSILRQDPNIIMVGEIRDAETANMATHAALTGHLVLSTLHTNDTAGALPRMINMGVEPFLITSSINLVVAQRLVRRICLKCREEMRVPAKLMEDLKNEIAHIPRENIKDLSRLPAEPKLYYGKGCPECNHGYKGRIGIFEVLLITPEIEELAIARRPANEIREMAVKSGMITMKQDGILKAFQGITTIDEVYQAVMNG